MEKCCLGDCGNLVMESSKVGACNKHEELVLELSEEEANNRRYEEERRSDYRSDVLEGIRAGNLFKTTE